MTFSEFASLSALDLAIAEVQGKVKVTRLDTVKPRSSDLILTQTKGNRCRTNRSSGTNFVRQVWFIKCHLLSAPWLTLWGTYVRLVRNTDPAVFCGPVVIVAGGVAYIKTLHYPNLQCMSFSIYVSLLHKKFSQKWERIKLISEKDRSIETSLE